MQQTQRVSHASCRPLLMQEVCKVFQVYWFISLRGYVCQCLAPFICAALTASDCSSCSAAISGARPARAAATPRCMRQHHAHAAQITAAPALSRCTTPRSRASPTPPASWRHVTWHAQGRLLTKYDARFSTVTQPVLFGSSCAITLCAGLSARAWANSCARRWHVTCCLEASYFFSVSRFLQAVAHDPIPNCNKMTAS